MKKAHWSESVLDFVRANASRFKDKDLAVILTHLTSRHVSTNGVQRLRTRLGIYKVPGRGVCRLQDRQVLHFSI